MTFQFRAARPTLYTGFYGRIEGEAAVFHIRLHPRLNRLWPMIVVSRDGDRGSCWAVESETANALAQSVVEGKKFFGRASGGEFLVNEYGEALVPSSHGDGRRVFVGRVHGALRFSNPFDATNVIDLSDDLGSDSGDLSSLPYIGSQYNLAAGGWIYRTLQTKDGRTFPRLEKPCDELIRTLRKIRPYGAVRFIVNPCGIIMTKRHDGDEWKPVYVGRVRAASWFSSDLGNPLNLIAPRARNARSVLEL
jgi:hypothetical protein